MDKNAKPIANSQLVLREEFDDWAILFDPDTGDGFGMNPIGVFVWKLLDGEHTEHEILAHIEEHFESVPADASAHLAEFIKDLIDRGFVGYEVPGL
ncbi:SynChlorMet cassette protein ScmD [Desulfomonile tiedjei]|uniref:Coenzyme PQQ synthesis protein D (PqqD) n=1 Tax=Desulfomonile tiedjei (strain ATCC 49306 / DSM 6799 / DCB-1) TaxID=706587 RepID=I4CCM0_DESTA|nr:SynChlorMet cassette protein ScmD [Desulfomonile tiedjei]AFM27311.1 Coenzyme PQQ synthesis protein D (PqqD) [Desulfomonile tiedjei DSM 6799]